MFRGLSTLAFIAVAAIGCASGGSSGGAGGSDPDVITSEQLRAAEGRHPSVQTLIREVKSSWLRPRASTSSGARPLPNVFVDGVYHGGARTLYRIEVTEVETIRHLSAPDATIRFGGSYPGSGAILVETR